MTATVGSLFAGVGGFDLGMEQAGFTVLWQAEWDKHCQSVLRRHWPDSALYGDVTDVNGAEIAPVDVITFGSPCQDLSVAGKRAGLDGDRSSMFFQAIRIIKEMRNATNGIFPRIAVWENVPGALSSNKGADFGVVLDSLADIGAVAIEWAVLDARWFGVPQRRRRVFVVAVFDPAVAERCPDPLLPVGEGRRRDSAKGKPKGKNVATSLADRIGGDSGERVNVTTGDVTGCLSGGAHPGGFNGQDAYTNQLIVESPAIPVLPGQQELFDQPFVKSRRAQSTTDHETWVEGDVAPTLNAFDNATETRATVVVPTIIFDSGSHGAPRESKDVVPTLTGRMGTGGNNTPLAAQPLVYDGYNQDLDDSGVHRTLRIGRDSSDFVAQPIIFDGTRHDDFRMDTEIVPTLKQRMGTGGGQVPMLAEPVAASFKPGASAKAYGIGYEEEMAPTLESGGGGNNKPAIIQPVTMFQPGAMVRMGGHVWEDGPVPTLRAEAKRGDNEPHIAQPIAFESTGGSWGVNAGETSPPIKVGSGLRIASPPAVAQPVAFSVREDAKANTFSATQTDVSLCLTDLSPTLKASQQSPSVSISFSHYSSDPSPSMEMSPTLRSGTNRTGHAVLTSPGLVVRRLTPVECERLMGWPDDHTRWTDDGREQADSHRYRQCGNGVATPVAAWIGSHLLPLLEP